MDILTIYLIIILLALLISRAQDNSYRGFASYEDYIKWKEDQ